MANKGIQKIHQMNAWKKELKSEGVSVPRGTGYDGVKKLYKKHTGKAPSAACSAEGKALASCSTERARKQTQKILFGFNI